MVGEYDKCLKVDLPSESPYMYVAKMEVSDLDAMISFLGTEDGKAFVKSWSIYIEPSAFFTVGQDV